MDSQALETVRLGRSFGQIEALNDVTLSIPEGEAFGLLGPNGAGKSTLVRILTTLMAPTRGSATVFGYDVTKRSFEVRKSVGYVPQEVSVDGYQTPRQILRMLGTFYHVPHERLRTMVEDALEVVELEDRADDMVANFSGGMKRRLDIATALLHRPRMLILDEPTLGLDVETRRRIWEYIKRLKKESMTVLLTTHYLDELEELSDRVAILDHGEVKAVGTLDELKSSLGSESIRVEFSASTMPPSVDCAKLLESYRRISSGGDFEIDALRNSVTLRVTDGVGSLSEVTSLLRQSGLAGIVKGVSLTKPSLEQVFFHYTKDEVSQSPLGDSGPRETTRIDGSCPVH